MSTNSSWDWDNCDQVFESKSSSIGSEDSHQTSLSSASLTSGESNSTREATGSSASIRAIRGSEVVADDAKTRTRDAATINDPCMETRVREMPSETRLSLKVVKATSHQTKLFPTSSIRKVKDVERVKFGRQEYCDVRINSEYCSREQFEIGFNGTDFFLTSLSRNTPTLVEGDRVSEPVVLLVGDRIHFDDIALRVAQITVSSNDSNFCVSLLRRSSPRNRPREVGFRVHLKLTNAYLPATAPINILPFTNFNPVYPKGNYAFGGKCDDWGSRSSSSSKGEVL